MKQEKVIHAIQSITFAVSNLFQQNHSKVIKPTKLLESSIKLIVKVHKQNTAVCCSFCKTVVYTANIRKGL